MIRAFVLYMLGPLGRQALEFYLEHSLWINGLVVVYGALLALAHLNLRRLERRAVERLLGTAPPGPRAADSAPAAVPWEEIIASASFFPFVAGPTGLVPRRCRPDVLERLIPASRLKKLMEEARGQEGRGQQG